MDKRTLYTASTKKNLSTGSSTHVKLVGMHDALPKVTWNQYFTEGQGCAVQDMYVYQDNQSAILFETNQMTSVGKTSRYIEYFVVTDRMKNKELRVI